jgi:hypothetical protein
MSHSNERRQLVHDTSPYGSPCRRCGLSYSIENSYVPCFLEGETKEEWEKRVGLKQEEETK